MRNEKFWMRLEQKAKHSRHWQDASGTQCHQRFTAGHFRKLFFDMELRCGFAMGKIGKKLIV
jgi:hypothetical protein